MVPTFRPPPETMGLVRVLCASGPVLVSDDGSPCTADPVLMQLAQLPEVRVVRNPGNRGIARGLNQGLAAARDADCRWLLTVDQDSMVDEHYAEAMADYAQSLDLAGVSLGALGAGKVLDASGEMTYPTRAMIHGGLEVTVTEEVVQSGTLWSVEALTVLGGFDESLGMDAIDAAACLGLRARGLSVAVNADVTLRHQIQGAQQIRLLGRDVMVTGHSPQRRSAIVRNRLRLFPREFAQSPTHAFRTLRRSAVNVLALPFRRRV